VPSPLITSNIDPGFISRTLPGFQIEGDIIGGKFLSIQEVIDDGQELTAGGEDLFEVGGKIRRAGIVCVFQQHFAVTDNGVQWGS
jgi:hypothetical protein